MTEQRSRPFVEFKYLGGVAPVQAEGTVAGHPFYFRARHQRWSFAVSENSEISPVSIRTEKEGQQHGYFRESLLNGEPFAASWMPEEEARRIIHECANQYLERKYFEERAERGSRQAFEDALNSFPDVPADEADSL